MNSKVSCQYYCENGRVFNGGGSMIFTQSLYLTIEGGPASTKSKRFVMYNLCGET